MSLLNPTSEDRAFADGHASAGLNKALSRIRKVDSLLLRALPFVRDAIGSGPEARDTVVKALCTAIEDALRTEYRDEPDCEWESPKPLLPMVGKPAESIVRPDFAGFLASLRAELHRFESFKDGDVGEERALLRRLLSTVAYIGNQLAFLGGVNPNPAFVGEEPDGC